MSKYKDKIPIWLRSKKSVIKTCLLGLLASMIMIVNNVTSYAAHDDPAVIAHILMPAVQVSSPHRIAVNPDTNRIYATDFAGGNVVVMDGNTNTIVEVLPFPTETVGIGVNPVTNLIYVSHRLTANVSVIDGSSNSVIATILVGNSPTNIGVNPNTNRIFVPNTADNTVSVIDGSSNTVIDTIAVGYWPVDVGVNPVTNRLYVAHFYGQAVWVIDGDTFQTLAEIPVSFNANGVAVNPDTNRVYVSGSTTEVPVIDGLTNSFIGPLPLGAKRLDVNPATNHIYITHFTDNTVTVVDAATNTVVAAVQGSHSPNDIAVNPNSDRVYVGHKDPTFYGQYFISVIGDGDELYGEIEWTDQFGTAMFDAATSVATADGYVYVGGHTQGALPGQNHLGSSDAFVRKYDVDGNELWTRQFGTPEGERVGGIFADATGVYVTGDTLGALPGQTNLGGRDIFVRKYDVDGNQVWTWQFGTDQYDSSNDVTVFGSTVYIVGGTWGEFPGQTYQGSTDAFVSRYDLDGTHIWTRQFGLEAWSVTANLTGVYVAGTMQTPGATAFLRKYDTDGNVVWAHQFGTAYGGASSTGVATDASGVYVVGSLYGVESLPFAFVRKYDFDGGEMWMQEFATLNTWATAVSANGSMVYVTGTAGAHLPAELPPGGYDAYVRAYDIDGNEMWTTQFGTTGSDFGYDISTEGGGIFAVGRTGGSFPDHASSGAEDAFVVKLAGDNQPPTADAGGPYEVEEGNSIILNGLGSNDPDPGDLLSYEWDLDYDGLSFEVDVTDPMPLFEATNLDGPDIKVVALRVTDSAGAVSDIDTASITVTNVAPTIEAITAPLEPVDISNQPVNVTIEFTDPSTSDLHQVQIGWGDSMTDTMHNASSPASQQHTYAQAGVYSVTAVVTDDDNDSDEAVYEYIVVYDPDGGFVTGGGWIWSQPGWCQLDAICADAEGKANFGFVSKYKKGASSPTGNTEFNFSAGGLNLHSDEYQWLVVNQDGTNAQFKGFGTINGNLAPTGEAFKYMIWANDGDPANDDTFRIKIWYEDEDDMEVIVYDNGFDQIIGGGSIKVHDGK